MIAEIVCVGTELLLGQITNTNARFLAERLAELGIDSYFQQVVGDNRDRLVGALKLAMGRSDFVVVSGGLGPTEDDLTKETVSELLGLRLVHDPVVAERIVQVLRGHRSPLVEAAMAKQSRVPEGATVLPNPVGTAPGLLISAGGRLVAMLPGPPQELEPIVRDHLVPRLEALLAEAAGGPGLAGGADAGQAGGADAGKSAVRPTRSYLHSRTIKFCGIGEPLVEEAVRDLIHSGNPTVAPYVSIGETHLRVTAKAGDLARARTLVEDMVSLIVARKSLDTHVFGFDDDTLAAACGRRLRERGLTLALAESLTGGLVGHLVTEVAGSSDYFERGYVVYSNRSKTELLGVDPELIRAHGAVSEEVALALARGARVRSGAGVAVALTGIAGPGGGRPEKPVGLVYIALAGPLAGSGGEGGREQADGGIDACVEECHRYVFTGERHLVKQRAAHRALTLLWRRLGDRR
jgi:nicotinamide-nucleotide amidase